MIPHPHSPAPAPVPTPSNAPASSSPPTSSTKQTLPPLPPHLIPSLLPYLLPPSPPLPPALLTPLFRQTLLYLQPDPISEMDRQLSAFPLPITSEALQRRLGALSKGYIVKRGEYGWDGEYGVSRIGIIGEYGGGKEGEEGVDVELDFQYNKEEGWGFHGLRLLPGEGDMGIKRTSDPSSISISPSSDHSNPTNFESTGSLDPYIYSNSEHTTGNGTGQSSDETADYWAGFSPPASPSFGPSDQGAIGIDEEERERQYWAQYSNAPSVAVSPAISRKASMMNEDESQDERTETSVPDTRQEEIVLDTTSKNNGKPNGRTRTGTIVPTLNTLPSAPSILSDPKTTPPTSQSTTPPRNNGPNDISLLRDRLRMKTLSLLRRCWTSYLHSSSYPACDAEASAGGVGQGEKEEKGLRWLSLGRGITSCHKSNGSRKTGPGAVESSGEARVRETMEMLWEIWEVYTPESDAEEEGFYRLVEQVLSQDEGSEGGEKEGRGGLGLRRNYSFEQQSYWE